MPPGDPPNGTSTASSNPTILCRLLVGHDTWLLDRPTDSGRTHKWKVFVGASHGFPPFVDRSFIRRVTFVLHESFDKPTRVVKRPPFEVHESGYGEFQVQIFIEFNGISKKFPINYDLTLPMQKTAHSDVEYFVEVKDPPKDFAALAFKHGGRFKHKADGQQSASKPKKPESDERRKKSDASSVDVHLPKKAAALSVSSKKLPAGPPSTSSDEHRPRPSTSESSRTEDKPDKPHRSHHHKEHKRHKEHKEEKSKHRHHKEGEDEKRRKSKKSKKERQPKEAEAIRPPSSASSAVSRATFNETNDEQEERRARDAAKAARLSAEERPPKRPRSPSPLPPPPTDAPKRPKLEAMPSPDNLFESASPDDFRAFTPDVLDRVDELAAAPAPMLSPLGKLTTLSVASTSPSIDGGMGRDEAHWRQAYELGRSLIAPLHADHFELDVLHKSGDLVDELADRFERPTPLVAFEPEFMDVRLPIGADLRPLFDRKPAGSDDAQLLRLAAASERDDE